MCEGSVLSAAPKGQTAAALTTAEDLMMRAAFGRYGGTVAAWASAAAVVRRLETSGPGHWVLCDCRPDGTRPPALIPGAETHIRRHETAGWPEHAVTCDFFREQPEQPEQPEQAELTRSFAPLPGRGLRLVRR